MHLETFYDIFKLLEENYDKVYTVNIKAIWYKELKDYNEENLKQAVIEIIKESIYFPTINQVIAEIKKIEKKNQKQTQAVLGFEDLTQEEYGQLVRGEITQEELIKRGRLYVR